MARGHSTFNPARDIPSLDGRIILITGGNNGLGKQSALDLSTHNPAEIWIAARDASKANEMLTALKLRAPQVSVQFLPLDLGSFSSIRDAAQTFTSSVSRLDILMLNAGVMGCPPGSTEEGYETHFGINHMGHAFLLKLLTPLMLKTASDPLPQKTRVVIVSSVGHKFSVAGGINFGTLKGKVEGASANGLYGQSKLANLLYAKQFAEHHREITCVSIHPGTVKTDLLKSGGNLLIRGFQTFVVPLIGVDVAEGAKNQLWAATAPNVESGRYYEPVGILGRDSSLAKNDVLGRKLWEWTAAEMARHDA